MNKICFFLSFFHRPNILIEPLPLFLANQACPWEWDSHGNLMGNVPWDGMGLHALHFPWDLWGSSHVIAF